MDFNGYDTGGFHDEMFEQEGCPRPGAALLASRLSALEPSEILLRQKAAERALLHRGITFNVYGAKEGTERIFPFDLVPRIVEASEWPGLERGIRQRILALNAFLGDIYGAQRILNEGVLPRHLVLSARGYLPACAGIVPPRGIYCHIVGIDLVRDRDGQFYVLEDNLRCPSGVSYVLENRRLMKRTFPEVFAASPVLPVDEYPSRLLRALQHLSPSASPTVVLLTPGRYNSAYFETARSWAATSWARTPASTSARSASRSRWKAWPRT